MGRRFRRGVKILLLLAIIAVVVPFTLPLKEGKPLLDYRELPLLKKLPDLSAIRMDDLPLPGLKREPGEPLTVYQWRDREGTLHYSETPPPEGVEYQRVTVDPNANLVPAPGEPPASGDAAKGKGVIDGLLDHYDPERLKGSIEAAKRVDEASKKRTEQQEELLEEAR